MGGIWTTFRTPQHGSTVKDGKMTSRQVTSLMLQDSKKKKMSKRGKEKQCRSTL